MRRLILLLAAAALVSTGAGCKKPNRVRAGSLDEDEGQLRAVVHVADPAATVQLVRGFHALESNAWRWTKGRFAVTLRPPPRAASEGAYLLLKFSLPESVVSRVGPVKLAANINGTPLEAESYSKNGDYTYRREVPASALQADSVTVDFALDKYLAAGQVETRELALIVAMIGLESK